MIKKSAENRLINKKTISSSLKDFLSSCQEGSLDNQDKFLRKFFFALFLLFLLFFPFLWESLDFSKKIKAPFLEEKALPISDEALKALQLPYRFLGKGKQSLAFVSQDDRWVIKFFNPNYFKVPFYARHSKKEWEKRKKREKFYQEGYLVAKTYLWQETALAYCHFAKTCDLPKQHFSFLGMKHLIDLNLYPFVLQKKAEPFFSYLEKGHFEEGLSEFIALIRKRIDLKIQDQDHEIEQNFGVIDGRVVQIDPGRLSLISNLEKPKTTEEEYWSTTHRLEKWLLKNHPEQIAFFKNL